ncbi:MAG: hypothetical protein KF773_09890 [Deltaproteobacteria bacterium]|nr:hypothetical protein [Deltaproteobacteria bacterium]MCW5808765.1 hypothetical protein [Deltaproteobacteria bacterium]
MRRLLLVMIGLCLFGGVAAADRHRDHRDNRGGGYRDNRGGYRDNRRADYRTRRVVQRNHVYHNNGRYVFANGRSFAYTRPVIRHRYYDVRVRPRVLVESYQTVPGYVWVPGNWRWDGYEWQWMAGSYQVDTRYTYYDGGGYTYNGVYYDE